MPTQRRAFTLVELLVSLALTMFIMVILSQAFLSAMETFRQLKAIGDMNVRLRLSASALRSDLQAMGLSFGSNNPKGLSDITPPMPGPTPGPEGQGFFRIWQDVPNTTSSSTVVANPTTAQPITVASATGINVGTSLLVDAIDTTGVGGIQSVNQEVVQVTSVAGTTVYAVFQKDHKNYPTAGFPIVILEGADADNLPSVRSVAHNLHFTVNLGLYGQRRENYFSAPVEGAPPSALPLPLDSIGPPAYRDTTKPTYNGQWAEVAYFLVPSGATTPGTTAGVPASRLYNLYRRIQVVVNPTDLTPDPATAGGLNDALSTTEPPRIADTKKAGSYFDVSCRSDPNTAGFLYFNRQRDLTIPERRFGTTATATLPSALGLGGYPLLGPIDTPFAPIDTTTTRTTYPRMTDQGESAPSRGADLLLSDVLSFDVQVFPKPTATFAGAGSDFINIPANGYPPANMNTATGYPATARAFDTWSREPASTTGSYQNPWDYSLSTTNNQTNTVPWPGTLSALQITLRIWDFKSQKTRQITIWQSRLGGTS